MEKNRTFHTSCVREKVNVILLKMKLLTILIFAGSMALSASTYSQKTRIDLQLENSSLTEILNTIEKKSEFIFIYNANIVNADEKRNISVKGEQIDKILELLFQGIDVYYRIDDRQIFLYKKGDMKNPESINGIIMGDQSQKEVLAGTVKDTKGLPLPGVSVVVKGTVIGTVTDVDGNYTLGKVPSDAVLVFSFVGMRTHEISITGKTTINVTMLAVDQSIDEVVIVGYGTQKKGLLTGSVQTVKVSETLKELPTTSAGNLLVGQFAGIDVSTPHGVPGESPSIAIRTTATWKNDQPITFVIDGIIRTEDEFNNLGSNEIESFTVLKDAAAASVYGSRSAGGVIVVTTNKGRFGKPSINYSFNTGFDLRTKGIALTDALQTAKIVNRFYAGTSQSAQYSQEEIDYLGTINKGWGYDQLNSIWKNPLTSQHNLSISGGSDRIKYFAAGSYTNQESFLEVFNYQKYNARLNVTADITKNLQIFAGLSMATTTKSEGVFETPAAVYSKLLVWQPYQPVYTNAGKPIDYGWIANIGSYSTGENGYKKSYGLNPNILLSVTYKIPTIEGLSAKASYSANWINNRNRNYLVNNIVNLTKISGTYSKIISTDDADIVSQRYTTLFNKNSLNESLAYSQDYQLNFQLNFDRTFYKTHHFQGLLVYEKSENTSGGFSATRENFPFYMTDQWWATSDVRLDSYVSGNINQTSGRLSYIGQFNYDYKSKYLLALAFREDGSMKFAPDKRWGFFPAVSAGYIISEEPFFKSISAIDFLKVRASIGMTGNDAVGGWQWQQSYISVNTSGIAVNNSYFGETPSKNNGLTYGVLANPNLTWEKVLSYNVGVDASFFKHWSGMIEYWYKQSYDILDQRIASYPSTFSLKLPDENYGQIDAQGFDFSLGYKNHSGDFKYQANLNMSYGWNKIIAKDYAANAKPIDIPTGTSTSQIKGYVFDQIIRTQDDLDKFNIEYPGYKYNGIVPALGMMVYKDLSGPGGVPDGTIDGWDMVKLFKNNFPIVYGLNLGLSWKGIDLDMMFNGKLGYQKSFQSITDFAANNRSYVGWYDNVWTPETPDGWLPQPKATAKERTYLSPNSAFWYEDASFLRMKYLNLSYTIPNRMYKRVLPIDGIKVFFAGTNLFYLSDFRLYDPELDSGSKDYPIMRTFNFGVKVSF